MDDPACGSDRGPDAPAERRAALGSAAVLAPSRFADALVSGATEDAWSALSATMVDGGTYAQVASEVVGPALAEVGARWAAQRLTVAQEHLATANATVLLGRAFAAADVAAPNGRKAVFACVAGNHHALGVRILGDAFALAGWSVRSLGANVPTTDLIAFVRAEAPDVLGLSLSDVDQAGDARAIAAAVRAPGGAPAPIVLVGGFPFVDGALSAADVGADAAHLDVRSALDALG